MANLKDAYELMQRGTIALAQVEANGIRVDVDYCKKTIARLERKIAHYTELLYETDECKEWAKNYGRSMNINSGDQLAHVLYNIMGYPVPHYTDSGKPATDQKALEAVEEMYESFEEEGESFFDIYFKIRKYEKAKTTYLIGTLNEVVDGYVHPFFTLHNVRSGRSASNTPNVQNQCSRNKEISKLIRKMYIPRAPNRHIVEIDYSALEVRIGACYHKDPTMINYIKDPSTCMHYDMASDIFMLPRERISKPIRQAGKVVNFSSAYGSWYPDIAKTAWDTCRHEKLTTADGVDIFEHLASKGIRELGACNKKDKPLAGTFEHHVMECERVLWEERFPVFNQWRKDTYAQYQKDGYFTNKHGWVYRGFFKRNEVLNYSIQCSGSNCTIWSLCEIQDEIKRRGMQSCVIGEIHDSIIGDVVDKELDDYLEFAYEIMTNRLRKNLAWINVPIEVEGDVSPVGQSWADKEGHSKFCSY